MDLQKLTQLLESIPHNAPTERERTFLEITEYPHLENVSSNVLEFFFDTEGEHGLGTLFLEALLATAEQSYAPGDLAVGDTQREAITQERVRLDLIIETATLVVGIENKLFHSLNNDLKLYEKHLRKQAGERKVICILLSLYPTPKSAALDAFIPITYADFFASIRKHMGRYVVEANQRYVPFLFDFMQTVEHLRQEDNMSDLEFRTWVSDHHSDIQNFLEEIRNFKSKLYDKVKALKAQINIENHKDSGIAINSWIWQPPDLSVRRSLVYDFVLPNGMKINFDLKLDATNWTAYIGHRKGTTLQALDAFLDRCGFLERHAVTENGYQIGGKLPFNTERLELAKKAETIINTIITTAQSLPKEGTV